MLLVGSSALLETEYDLGRCPRDCDYICTWEEFQQEQKRYDEPMSAYYPLSKNKWVMKFTNGSIHEYEIAWTGSSGWELLSYLHALDQFVVADQNIVYTLKMSHRYLKDSPHFLKTMKDILFLREKGCVIPEELTEWYKKREEHTYWYKLPNLNQSKEAFFIPTGQVSYKYDHDDLHRLFAIMERPSYTYYMKDGAEVMTDKEKFFSVSEEIRLYGGLEEALVLAAERSLIPFDFAVESDKAFRMALMKVCTSITGGWFREYCWNNYFKIEQIYINKVKNNWIDKLEDAIMNNKLKLHGE